MLYRESGRSCYGAWVLDYDGRRSEDVHVVKAHNPRSVGGIDFDKVVTGYRDLRCVLSSARRMGWADLKGERHIGAFLNSYIENLKIWEDMSVHTSRYETMTVDRFAEVRRVAKALALTLRAKQLRSVCACVDALRPPAALPTGNPADVDLETQLHPGHLAEKESRLDSKSRRYVEKRYAAWLLERGYEIRPTRQASANHRWS
jgi:hypothetical protein